jgi:cis-3-alkyl-4-acyloxetan-2-one decarboxylase
LCHTNAMWDTFLHKWLRVPYTLHVHTDKRPIKPRATVLFLHGIGNSGDAWRHITQDLPGDIRVIVIDLLGFGSSPQPSWAVYNAKTQARSVIATFLKLHIRQPVIIVGHSLGALVGVEVAVRYPLLVKSLILCSPPFYKASLEAERMPSYDSLLKDLYQLAKRHPKEFVAISQLAVKLGLVNSSYNVTHENTPIYMNALSASIINQTTLGDAQRLRVPTRILYGRFDPVLVFANLKWLAENNNNVTLKPVLAGHEMFGPYISVIHQEITKASEK